jgi:hypothetical protein
MPNVGAKVDSGCEPIRARGARRGRKKKDEKTEINGLRRKLRGGEMKRVGADAALQTVKREAKKVKSTTWDENEVGV